MICTPRKTVVVIGNGMVGHRFPEKLVPFDRQQTLMIVTFREVPRLAYDRVNLTKFEQRQVVQRVVRPRIADGLGPGMELG